MNIDDDVAPPEDEPKQASKKKAALPDSPAASLLAAFKFIALAQKKTGNSLMTHSFMSGGYLAASDGIITVATPIAENLRACPNTHLMIAALSKCTEALSITQTHKEALIIKSGAYSFAVPCCDPTDLELTGPDGSGWPIDSRLRDSLLAVAGVSVAGAQDVKLASVWLLPDSTVATNGGALLEHWHGLGLPRSFMVPKASAVAIAKADKALKGLGYSNSSATFWYEDGSFIKTALYSAAIPAHNQVFDMNLPMYEVPPEFFKAVKIVSAMNKESRVYFNNGYIMSSLDNNKASTYQMPGLPEGMGFSSAYLLKVEKAFKFANFGKDKVQFQGDSIRGVCMALDVSKIQPTEEDPYARGGTGPGDEFDDDIPF